ncbi:gorasp2-prov protein [Cyclospora cayetanensis]|uniref:Gorasp2-prov protein n=1 Tax=Cyclospora cayetanensis TaxID=88456 RepID=A0A1D3CY14_9EIME|nr:gorasp2-prov protein [Cyclospora cayetanensis]
MGNAAPTGEAGFRVLRIQPGTPAETADFELFFDFIIQIENESLCSPDVSVQSVLKRIDAAEGRPMRLTVYNARHRMNREVYVQPARAASSLVLLGVSLQYCPFEEALSSPLRVLGVLDASPAQKANLQEGSDYILGDEKGAYRGVSDLIMAAEEHMGSSLTLFVFNKDTERVRRLVLQPCDNWGGEGCLGCDVGSGFLHRVPFSRAAKDDADGTSTAAAAVAAGLRMSPPLDVPDPTTDVLASCLLLPTTNSPLRDPTFAGATWGAPLVKGANVSPNAEAAGATFALDGFGTSAELMCLVPADLAYDLPYAAAMMSHSEAVIEGKPQPSTVLRPTAAAYDWLVSVVSLVDWLPASCSISMLAFH